MYIYIIFICYIILYKLQTRKQVCPARISEEARAMSEKFALKAVESLEGRGIYGVELFLMKDGSVILNEIAPRPHNTGHYTIEANDCCQFENHLRAVMGMPLGSTRLKVKPRFAQFNSGFVWELTNVNPGFVWELTG